MADTLRNHAITPALGSARRARDGLPANLMHVSDYPVEAVCIECGEPIRCQRFYAADWIHIERFTMPSGAA